MKKKYLCCVHDKKSDTYDGFMLFDNMSHAMRAFQSTCEQNETFNKWPEDFEFVLVCEIGYENGEIDELGNITKKGKFLGEKPHHIIIGQAQDFVQIKKAKDEKITQ